MSVTVIIAGHDLVPLIPTSVPQTGVERRQYNTLSRKRKTVLLRRRNPHSNKVVTDGVAWSCLAVTVGSASA